MFQIWDPHEKQRLYSLGPSPGYLELKLLDEEGEEFSLSSLHLSLASFLDEKEGEAANELAPLAILLTGRNFSCSHEWVEGCIIGLLAGRALKARGIQIVSYWVECPLEELIGEVKQVLSRSAPEEVSQETDEGRPEHDNS